MLRRLWIGSQELGAVSFENTWYWITRKWSQRKWSCEFGKKFELDHKKVKLSIIEKDHSEPIHCWEDFGLDLKKVKALSFEKTLDWITRMWSWQMLRRLWIGSQESGAGSVEKTLDWITRKWSCRLLRRLWSGSQWTCPLWRRLSIRSQESKIWEFWEDFGLDYKNMKLTIVEKTLHLITRKWGCRLLRWLWSGSQWTCLLLRRYWTGPHKKVKSVSFEKTLDWITRKWSWQLLRRLWIGSQELGAGSVENTSDWITRKRSLVGSGLSYPL
jgi:DNA-binding HxlR family transcriptional regulator